MDIKNIWRFIFWAVFIGVGILIFIFLFFIPSSLLEENLIDNSYSDISKGPTLYFYDKQTNCSLNGKIYSGGTLIGEVRDGKINLTSEDYDKINSVDDFFILGVTDYCFGKNVNLPFYRVWSFVDWNFLFEFGGEEVFEVDLNPRHPIFPQEMQGFIRPEEVEKIFLRISLDNESVFGDIETIIDSVYINWVSDFGRFGEKEYWQTPKDFEKNKGGDCEDWAVYAISLLQAYNSDLDCYLALWNTHANVLCVINENYAIYDQDKIKKIVGLGEEWTLQEKKITLRTWRNGYFETYGIGPDDAKLIYLINQKEIIGFENGKEDFIDWAVNKL